MRPNLPGPYRIEQQPCRHLQYPSYLSTTAHTAITSTSSIFSATNARSNRLHQESCSTLETWPTAGLGPTITSTSRCSHSPNGPENYGTDQPTWSTTGTAANRPDLGSIRPDPISHQSLETGQNDDLRPSPPHPSSSSWEGRTGRTCTDAGCTDVTSVRTI